MIFFNEIENMDEKLDFVIFNLEKEFIYINSEKYC